MISQFLKCENPAVHCDNFINIDKKSSFSLYRKVLKEIYVGELQPDETVDAMREARLLSNVSAENANCTLS